jgi:aspartate/methionine/tyrosine aminotransferase
MASYLDQVPFSGIIRIRDLMYSVKDPYRLDQGDVSFDSPDTVKAGMTRAIADNHSHYVQTTGIPRLRELIAGKLRRTNGIPIDDVDDVLVTNGGIHGLYILCLSLLEPGDEVLIPDPACRRPRQHPRGAGGGRLPAARDERLAARSRRGRSGDHAADARPLPQFTEQPDRRRADARVSRAARRPRAAA